MVSGIFIFGTFIFYNNIIIKTINEFYKFIK